VLALAPRLLPESRSESAARGSYDVAGAISITLGTMALVFTLIKANTWGWTSGRTIAGFAIAVVLIGAFVVIERRQRDPLVPLRIFSNRSLAAADVTFLLVAAALFGVFYFCTLYLQQVLGFSALKTGVAYLPLTLTLVATSALAARLVDRFTPKPVLAVGLVVATAGFVLLTRITGHGDYASHVLPAMIALGAGLGTSFVPITIAATTGRASTEIPTGDAMSNAAAGKNEVGIATGATGGKMFVITTLIDGRGIATGMATVTGVADDSMTTGISATQITSDTSGTVVSDWHQPITRLRTSFVTTVVTNCRSHRMVAAGSELTMVWY